MGDFFDHAHESGVVAVALEVTSIRPSDALDGRICRRSGGRVVRRRREPLLLRLRDFAEDALLRFEVVVEGRGREVRGCRDV